LAKFRSLHDKSLKELGVEGMYRSITKAICGSLIANIILGKVKEFLPKPEQKIEFLARVKMQEKKIKMDTNRKGKSQIISIYIGNMILYLKDPGDSTRKTLISDNIFSKVAG
jgi:hypothetical protein